MDNWLKEKAQEEPSDWSKDSREWAEDSGLITGRSNGNKAYKSFMTREEVVEFVKRFYDTFINKTE